MSPARALLSSSTHTHCSFHHCLFTKENKSKNKDIGKAFKNGTWVKQGDCGQFHFTNLKLMPSKTWTKFNDSSLVHTTRLFRVDDALGRTRYATLAAVGSLLRLHIKG